MSFRWYDLKYLMAYIAPAAAWIGLYYRGWFSPGAIYIGFVLLPVLEFFIPGTTANEYPEHEQSRSKILFFDILLYLNIPIVYFLMWYFLQVNNTVVLTVPERLALILNMGLILGTAGINVGHELGHRPQWFNILSSILLLTPALYTHFFIEHNRGHHKQVGTPADPATARLGESFYRFWWRSVWQGYRHAWSLELHRLNQQHLPWYHITNHMWPLQAVVILYLIVIYFSFGWLGLLMAVTAGIVGFTFLELVNYIEHYGLMRHQRADGSYERVEMHHSWNSNHPLGRIFLYELTRHADHHYKSQRKYQILRHFQASPQMPWGYPASILLSLVPPLWFRLIHPILHTNQKN